MKISIITTMYKSQDYIEEFYTRAVETVKKITNDYEVIFVDDGSPDSSLSKAIELHNGDSKVKVIELSRNFGHHKAMMTGLRESVGDYILLIDCDLEESPELLSDFYEMMQKDSDIDVVYGVQKTRQGNFIKKYFNSIFYNIFNFFSDIKIIKNLLTIRLMKKDYVKEVVKFEEKSIFLAGILSYAGFNQKAFYMDKKLRQGTTYSFALKLSLITNSIVSFSSKPLYYILYVGLIISCISFLFIIYIIFNKLTGATVVNGWSSIIIVISMFSGIIITFLGVISVYIAKIFEEVKNRPYTIIRNISKKDNR